MSMIVRRWRLVAASAAVLLLLGGAVLVAGTAPAAGAVEALPDRVVTPPLGTLRITDPFPIGAAAVAVSGFGGNDPDSIAVVDAETGRYRAHRVGPSAPVGEVVLLSPDGTRLAHQGNNALGQSFVEVVDLGDRSVDRVGPGDTDSVWTRPLAWSPDGSQLVLADAVPQTPERSAYSKVVSLVDVASGSVRTLATADDATPLVTGYAVAFTADGRRLALQLGTELTIVDLATDERRTLTLPANRTLAGKGAWQPDGRTLTLAERDGDDWRLVSVDPATGSEAPGPPLPTVEEVLAVRLLGWQPDGAALVVAYQPRPKGMGSGWSLDQRIHYGHVGGVQLVSLLPGAGSPTVRVTMADGIRAVDVADRAVASGVIRPAGEPSRWPGPRVWLWLVVGVVASLLLAAVGWPRRTLRRRPDTEQHVTQLPAAVGRGQVPADFGYGR
ncbi:WD40 repeat domain-containing protein [Micromonospora sp. NBC_01813]|uniref:WD40 repeat domain-containing protein n=1 Tax=Micromonospora sp. NBC_01813 TaxID=2975988 RepID=UPI002DDB555A|nr:hypothetical protein [Micromonospora sp. NBC_01813]WSA07803.1 hypothetical protein OG958_26830 [Micromonospora sp. NBC_01813]